MSLVPATAPTADFASMMHFVTSVYVFDEECYPNGTFDTAEGRARFVLDHTMLHLRKSIGKLAAEREEYNHGGTMHIENMRVATTKLFVNLLSFAGELGMTADVLQSGLDRDYAGYFGPLWLMRRESLTERCSFDGPPAQVCAGVIMHRLLILDMLKGRLAEYRLVEFSEIHDVYSTGGVTHEHRRHDVEVIVLAMHALILQFLVTVSGFSWVDIEEFLEREW